jgi:hypothetical protein
VKEIEEFDDDDFVSLWILHFNAGISIGALATSIESSGVWGWDRFGRFACFGKDSVEACAVFDRLALQYARNEHPMSSEEPDDPVDDLLCLWGWSKRDLPDFACVEADQPPQPKRRPADHARAAKSSDMLIGALTEFALGEKLWKGRAQFKNQTELIVELSERYKGMAGMSKRTLEKAIPRGLDAVNGY